MLHYFHFIDCNALMIFYENKSNEEVIDFKWFTEMKKKMHSRSADQESDGWNCFSFDGLWIYPPFLYWYNKDGEFHYLPAVHRQTWHYWRSLTTTDKHDVTTTDNHRQTWHYWRPLTTTDKHAITDDHWLFLSKTRNCLTVNNLQLSTPHVPA